MGGPAVGRRPLEVRETPEADAGPALAWGFPAVISLRSFAKYDARVPDRTVTSASMPRRGLGRDAAAWALTIALDCEDLFGPARRVALGRATEIDVGRGPARAVHREDERIRLDLHDRRASQNHVRLRRSGDGWTLEDRGSKNGTRVNGERVERFHVGDGDVIEVGATFLVLRRDSEPIRDLEVTGAAPAAGATLSPTFERELAVLPKIAPSRVPILVRGESGTGKELVADAVHALARRSGPLVAVNCGSIPATLIESELFGTRRGAFSGAEDRAGLVRTADRGTLFLDEVAELSAPAQAALLRLLQEGEIQPLGAGKSVVVDVRVVAATNRPLERLIAEGSFRRDLHARLRGYEIVLPTLRRRIEDLGILVATLLRRLEPEPTPRRLARRAARALFQHGWTYNVRELEHALRAAVAVASSEEISVRDLKLADEVPADSDANERERLSSLVAKHGGNLSAVARELATSRSQVKRLLGRHGVDWQALRGT